MSSFYKNSYQTIIPMLTRLSFPCLFVCHSRTRCGNLSFFYNSACSLPIACWADNTEAKVEVGVIGVTPELVAHLAVVGAVVPAAAAGIVSVAAEGIPAPFIYVAAHVVQAVAVRLFLRYRMRYLSAVTVIPSDRTKIITASVTVTLTSSCSILPFVNCR